MVGWLDGRQSDHFVEFGDLLPGRTNDVGPDCLERRRDVVEVQRRWRMRPYLCKDRGRCQGIQHSLHSFACDRNLVGHERTEQIRYERWRIRDLWHLQRTGGTVGFRRDGEERIDVGLDGHCMSVGWTGLSIHHILPVRVQKSEGVVGMGKWSHDDRHDLCHI